MLSSSQLLLSASETETNDQTKQSMMKLVDEIEKNREGEVPYLELEVRSQRSFRVLTYKGTSFSA